MHLHTTRSVPSTLISPMIQHEKQVRTFPFSSFVVTTLIAVPIWAVSFVPITVLYQIGKKVWTQMKSTIRIESNSSNDNNDMKFPPLDSGYIVDSTALIPRNKRKYDIIVLGATGFTGQLAVRHLVKTYGVPGSSSSSSSTNNNNNNTPNNGYGKVQWAIAGRNETKLRTVLQNLGKEYNLPTLQTDIDIIIVDTFVPCTMPKLVENTRCVATTVGPYTQYGNSVIEFCVKFGTHYVDITGETEWIQIMIHQWQDIAKQTGSKLIPFCGHDSIPWDISVVKLQGLLKKECNDDLRSVTFWDASLGGAPGGTFATVLSMVEGTARRAPKFDIDPFARLSDHTKSPFQCRSMNPILPEKTTMPWNMRRKYTKSTDSDRNYWIVPFVMAGVNHKVVQWSYALRQQGSTTHELVYREAMVTTNFYSAMTIYSGLVLFGSMFLNPLTLYFMKHYIIPKPGEGPSMHKMENEHFLCVYGEGIGINGNVVESIFYLPKDAGCLETSRLLIESGLCLGLVDDNNQLPVQEGGFYPPSVALGNDILFNRLIRTGTEYVSRVVPANEIIVVPKKE